MAAPTPRPPSSQSNAWSWLTLLVLLVGGGWAGWHGWLAWQDRQRDLSARADQRVEALAERLSALRTDQRVQAQRLQQAEATNRVLREELLGIGQRAALIEDSFARYTDPDRHGALALRLDETELLLTMGQQRLAIASDLDGARRAYALAAGVLEGVDDPVYLSLRQTLVQERAMLDALGVAPRTRALAELGALAVQLADAPVDARAPDTLPAAPWWRRALAGLVDVRPSDRAIAVHAADRAAAHAGMQLEISLARAAAERGDQDGWRAALQRTGIWSARLWPPSPERERRRAQLEKLAATPLSPSLPTLGSTLQQLRQLRAAR